LNKRIGDQEKTGFSPNLLFLLLNKQREYNPLAGPRLRGDNYYFSPR
jgi:hypothetical protein